MGERLYWLGFSFFHGIGPTKFKILLEKFWTAENAWNATELELKHSGIGEKVAERFLAFRKEFSLKKYAEQLDLAKVSYVIQTDPTYPTLLSKIDSPPIVLYVKGDVNVLQQKDEGKHFIAVVGSRKITEYGKQVTQMLTETLADAGCVIVSGLAMGVDAIAHAAALRMKGKTIAVLGCGVDCCTPRENESLYRQIITDGGTIISEVPLGHKAFIGSFPARNRIIAGLSSGVLVTEGAEDSGSLITADFAMQMGRKVFAVPGPITSSVSKGPIALISRGAKTVMHADDILETIGLHATLKKAKDFKVDTNEEQQIVDLLVNESLYYDELVRKSKLNPSDLGTLLSLMEMKGFIMVNDTGKFTLVQ